MHTVYLLFFVYKLDQIVVLPENLPSLAVQTVDAAGRKTVFQWK